MALFKPCMEFEFFGEPKSFIISEIRHRSYKILLFRVSINKWKAKLEKTQILNVQFDIIMV